jgi:predicted transposase YbfD/YdcC
LERLVGGWFQTITAAGPDLPSATEQASATGQDATATAKVSRPAAVAVDGKTLRGSADQGKPVHLLAALDHDTGTVLAQRRVEAKTNEVTGFRPLLEQVELTGRVVTADAMHCQREHARWLVEDAGADYLLSPRTTSRVWSRRSAAPPRGAFPPPDTRVDRGHGRVEHRTVRAAPAGDGVSFPGVRQVVEILRHVTDLDGSNPRTTVEYGVTSLDAERAGAGRWGCWRGATGRWRRCTMFGT